MNGVPVEAVHPLLFARQRWVTLMVEVVAACSVCQYSDPPPVTGFCQGSDEVTQFVQNLQTKCRTGQVTKFCGRFLLRGIHS